MHRVGHSETDQGGLLKGTRALPSVVTRKGPEGVLRAQE